LEYTARPGFFCFLASADFSTAWRLPMGWRADCGQAADGGAGRLPKDRHLLRQQKNPDRLCMWDTLRVLDFSASLHLPMFDRLAAADGVGFVSCLIWPLCLLAAVR